MTCTLRHISLWAFAKHQTERKNPNLFFLKIMWKRDNLEYLGVYGRSIFENKWETRGLDLPGLC